MKNIRFSDRSGITTVCEKGISNRFKIGMVSLDLYTSQSA
jgi:hypothetical protein